MFKTYIEITIGMSIVILLMLVLSNFLSNRYTAKWKYIVWLCVAIRLLVPINYNSLETLINITPPETKIGISMSFGKNNNDNAYPISIYPVNPNKSISNVDANQSTQINSPSKEVEQKNASSINNEISIVDLLKNIWVIGMILFGIFITIPRRNPRIMENTMEISAILIVTHKPCQSLNELIPLKRTSIPIFCIADSPFYK